MHHLNGITTTVPQRAKNTIVLYAPSPALEAAASSPGTVLPWWKAAAMSVRFCATGIVIETGTETGTVIETTMWIGSGSGTGPETEIWTGTGIEIETTGIWKGEATVKVSADISIDKVSGRQWALPTYKVAYWAASDKAVIGTS